MKQLILIIALLALPTLVFSQQDISMYKDYKSCTDCFDKFKSTNNLDLENWKKSGLGNYGIPPATKSRSFIGEHLKPIAVIFLTAILAGVTYTMYNKINNSVNETLN